MSDVAVLVIDMLNTYRHDDEGERPELVEPIAPEEGTLFLEKVRHSAFYATPLAYLLGRLETKRLILTGQVTEQCILYTALDAYIRHFAVAGAAGRGRRHSPRSRSGGVADDGAQHASRARASGEVPGLTPVVASCWPAVRPRAPHPIRRF